jgi:hypothetical protein
MVNRVAAAVKGVAADNVVIAGGLAPFRDITPVTYRQDPDWGPLSFMRAFFCLSKSLKPVCAGKAQFDVWSHHPYTSGGPTHKAVLSDDVSLGDLPKLRKLLAAAVRAGHIDPGRMPSLWVTEFSWDSNPPDPEGVPAALEARWTSEALYRMWLSGVSLVTWYLIRDLPIQTSYFQSGLYFRGQTLALDKPKPSLQAFRFPFVAFRRGAVVDVWGRTPTSSYAPVAIEQRQGARWRTIATLPSNKYGIFRSSLTSGSPGPVRARLAPSTDASRPFSLTPVADQFFNPFGQLGIEPKP